MATGTSGGPRGGCGTDWIAFRIGDVVGMGDDMSLVQDIEAKVKSTAASIRVMEEKMRGAVADIAVADAERMNAVERHEQALVRAGKLMRDVLDATTSTLVSLAETLEAMVESDGSTKQ